ncbi:hypothetical protein P8452_71315 [Trifolium repens]|nr:hypothetical protein P8452_71315 [Trifolium repens]
MKHDKATPPFSLSANSYTKQSLPPSTGELQRMECLRSRREISSTLAERPAKGDFTGEMKESLQKLVKPLKGSGRNYGAFKIDMAHFGNQ